MEKKHLLDVLEQSHNDFLDVLDTLDEQLMLEPKTIGNWSIKDLLMHLTLWETQLITLLFQVRNGQKPTTVHFSNQSDDDINERWHIEYQDRDLVNVLEDYYGIRDQTIRRVQEFSANDLFDSNRYPWAKGHALWEWIAGSSYEHEKEHLEELKQLLVRRNQNTISN